MDTPDKDGNTRRKQKLQVFKQKSAIPGNEDLEIEFKDDFIPFEYRFTDKLFWLLFDGNKGITLENMYYYEKLTGIKIDGNTRKLLLKLSNEALNYLIKKKEKK